MRMKGRRVVEILSGNGGMARTAPWQRISFISLSLYSGEGLGWGVFLFRVN